VTVARLHRRGVTFSNFSGRVSRLRYDVVPELRRHRGLRPRTGLTGSLQTIEIYTSKHIARGMLLDVESLLIKGEPAMTWPRRGCLTNIITENVWPRSRGGRGDKRQLS
jgi:hypothetical protein